MDNGLLNMFVAKRLFVTYGDSSCNISPRGSFLPSTISARGPRYITGKKRNRKRKREHSAILAIMVVMEPSQEGELLFHPIQGRSWKIHCVASRCHALEI